MPNIKHEPTSLTEHVSKAGVVVIMPPQGCTTVRNRIINTTLQTLMESGNDIFQNLMMLELGAKADEQSDAMYLYVEVPWADVEDTDGITMQVSTVASVLTKILKESEAK